MLVIIDLPMIRPWVQQLQAPGALSLSLPRGAAALRDRQLYRGESPVAVLPAALLSVLGYAFKRLEPAPMILGFALGHARIEWRSDVVSRTVGQPRLGGRDGCATRTDGTAGDPCRPRRGVSGVWLRPR